MRRIAAFKSSRIGTWIALALTLLATAACSPARSLESLSLLQSLAPAAGTGDHLEPRRLAFGYSVEGRAYDADLYVPTDSAAAALVLVPGVTPAGKDDRRLIDFARALSRGRFLVMVPDIPNFRALQMTPADITAIGDAVIALGEGSQAPKVGLVAISYAAGPAVIAASRARIRNRLAFAATIGGYYDSTAAIRYFTTGHYHDASGLEWRRGKPNPFAKWVFLKSNLARVASPDDRALLDRIAEAKLRDPGAPIGASRASLGAEGRSIFALLDNRLPNQVPDLIAQLPTPIRADIQQLDPRSQDLTALEAELLLIHGRDDPVIPYTESAALARVIGPGQAKLFLVDELAHVDLGAPGLGDAVTLWRAAYAILAARDGMPKPDISGLLQVD